MTPDIRFVYNEGLDPFRVVGMIFVANVFVGRFQVFKSDWSTFRDALKDDVDFVWGLS